MTETRHVALIGMMGSGKTTVGRRVADRLGWRFADSDALILERTGTTVRELWERGGEATYRPLERAAVVDELASPGPSVLAAPGGAVLDPDATRALQATGVFVVWLRARTDTLLRRVHRADHRPLLGNDPATTLPALAAEREPRYAELADAVVDVDELDADGATEHVLGALPSPVRRRR